MQHTPKERRIISRLAAALADSSPSLAGRLQQCLCIIREGLDAGRGALHLFPGGNGAYIVQEQNVLRLPDSSQALHSAGVIRSVVTRPAPVLVSDSSDDAGPAEAPEEYQAEGRSLIAAPLLAEEDEALLGVLHFMAGPGASGFTEGELERLTAYSQWIAPFVADHFRTRNAPLEAEAGENPASGNGGRLRDPAEELEFVVHDLKSPLSALITNLDLLHGLSRSEKQVCLTQTALRSANKLYQRIDQILDLLRLQERESSQEPSQPVDLEEAIHRQIQEHRPLLDQKSVEVRLSGPRKILVPMEEPLLGHLLQNLLSNAIRHAPPHSGICVTWGRQAEDHDAGILVCVEDSGEGMEEEKKRQVRRCVEQGATARAKERTGGLGLVICARVINILQGRLWIEDLSPRGTRACFTLPGAPSDSSRPEAHRPEKE